jgi:hypothetical protein
MILSAIRPKGADYFLPPLEQTKRITGVNNAGAYYFTWISSSGQPYLFQGSATANTPLYKYTLNGNIATLDTSFNTGNLQYGTKWISSIYEPLNIMTVYGYNTTTTTTHHTIDLTTGQVIDTQSGALYIPRFWFESTIHQMSGTTPIYARIVTFSGQVPTYGNPVEILSSDSYWIYNAAIRNGTQYFITNASNSRAMFDSSDSSIASKAAEPEDLGFCYFLSADVIRYYTIAAPIGYYDYTISTDSFSGKSMTNLPSDYLYGYIEYNPIRKKYIMTSRHEKIMTSVDLSFTTNLESYNGGLLGDITNIQDVRTCYDDDGQWYMRYINSSAVPPEAGALTTAPSVMKKND